MADTKVLGVPRVLVVEDEYLIAADLAEWLEGCGIGVVGPAGSVEDALKLLETEAARIDAGVLDVNVGDQRVYPVAEALAARGVPFVFATGYDEFSVADRYVNVPRYKKPLDKTLLARWLAELAVPLTNVAGPIPSTSSHASGSA
jgi:two-component SAPR family response regulator